jgi:hypothetical protein
MNSRISVSSEAAWVVSAAGACHCPGGTRRATASSRSWRAWSARSRSVSLREATVISQPRGRSGMPSPGHCAAAAISASWVASSAASKCP